MLLSLCVIAKNEEKSLPRCLESVKDIVNEMIVVDTGSTDHTVEIAKSYGAKVFYFEWNENFSDAKNYALEQAKGDWIMTMDADEELSASDKDKVLPLLYNTDIDIYLFQTLSYVGNEPGIETMGNLNLRLIRNHKGYKYRGAIHEQIYSSITNDLAQASQVRTEKIVVYHYGYLKKVAIEKNKSNRNMKILEKLLENDPHNNFHLYNMGCEYLRLKNFEKALECFKRACKNLIIQEAHTPKLLLKMILTLDTLNMYDEALKIIDTGLKYYPQFTDLEYLKACIFHKQKKYLLAIKGFKKCISMGEPPMYLCNINDVGGYRAYYALGEIYSQLGDYDEAYNYYIETIKAKPDYYQPLYRIAEIVMKKERDINLIKAILESYFNDLNAGAYIKLGDMFFGKGKYDIALEYFIKAQEILKTNQNLYYYAGMSKLFLKDFKGAYNSFEKIREGKYYEQAVYKMILCEIVSNHMENAEKLLYSAKDFKDSNTFIVLESFKNLVEDKECNVISYDKEESKTFVNNIFILLNILIKISTPEMFEKSLQLLNLIDNDEVLLRLAKLYYHNGYYKLAYQEFIRSIKIFDRIDQEGLEMMKNTLDMPISFTS